MKKISVREAAQMRDEEDSWRCPSCTTLVEPGSEFEPYCPSCGSYWRDVEDGMFGDDYSCPWRA